MVQRIDYNKELNMSAYAQYGYSYPSASQLFVSGQTATGTSPPLGTSVSSLSPGSSSAGVASGAISPNGSAPPGAGSTASGTSCCENGRPIMSDPVSGQTVCSCQYDSARLTLSYPRLPTSGVGVYGTPYPSTDQNPYPSIGVDSSAFYSPLQSIRFKRWRLFYGYVRLDEYRSTNYSGYYPYDPTLAAYGYSAGYDLAARRKNATRESTATLKAWLNEHKKNPYPTKGEKIMLAIITKMTLTQVSTWFANARRRLKKENKMTWEPKNKTDEDDDAILSDSDEKDKDDLSYDAEKVKVRLMDDKEALHHVKIENRHEKDVDEEDETDEEDHKPEGLSLTHLHLHHHNHNHMHHSMLGGLKEEMKIEDCGIPIPATKPKIWSLADTAACKTPPPSQQQPWLMPNTTCSGSPMIGMNMSMNSFALPSATSSSAPYSRYSGFLGHYNGSNHSTMGNYNPPSGFPEVQTDTPPQTPPNMKLPSVANNIINSNSCFGSNSNNNNNSNSTNHHNHQAHPTAYHHNNFANNFNRMQPNQLSPHKERQDYQQQQIQHSMRPTANTQQHQPPVHPNEGTAFKPFFKNSPPLNNGFVSPV